MNHIRTIICLLFVTFLVSCLRFEAPPKRPAPISGTDSTPVADASRGDTIPTYRTLISNRVRAIAADANNIWIGTDRGVSRWQKDSDSWTHYTETDGLAYDGVTAIVLDPPWVWFATEAGVSRLQTETGAWQTFRKEQGLVSNRVSAIAVDGNFVWFGTDQGLSRYDKSIDSWAVRTKRDGLVSNVVRTLAVDNEYVWVGMGAEPERRRGDERGRHGDRGDRERPSQGGVSRYHRATDSWNQYTQQDGLVGNEINAIAIDETYVWFGTYNAGISLFNQVEQSFIRTYTKTDLLESNQIQVIAADGHQVWFGTANAGVHRYIRSVNTWVYYTEKDGLASDNVSSIAIQGNDVWFGSREHGLSRYDKVRGTWVRYTRGEQLVDNDVRSICQDSAGNLWIATPGGLSRYDPQRRVWDTHQTHRGLPSDYITTVTSQGADVWVGTDRGPGWFDPASGTWHFYRAQDGPGSAFVTSLLSTDKGVWVGTNKGLWFHPADGSDWEQPTDIPELLKAPIRAMAWIGENQRVGRHPSLWIGTASAEMADDSAQMASVVSLPDVNILQPTSIGLWAGTRDGLWRYDPEATHWESVAERFNVRAIAEWKGLLWIGSAQGLESFDPTTSTWQDHRAEIPYPIRDLAPYDGTLWIATPVGLAQYRPASDPPIQWHRARPRSQILREPGIAHITFEGDNVWMANWYRSVNGAIFRYHRPTGTWQRFLRQDILGDTDIPSMSRIYRIQPDRSDTSIWFATNLGVLRYDRQYDAWERFTTQDGLASNEAREILTTDSAVWITSASGAEISRYDRQSHRWSIVELADKFPFAQIKSIAADEEDLWVGLSSSVFRYEQASGTWGEITPADGLGSVGSNWIEVDPDYVWVAGGGWGRSRQRALSRYDRRHHRWDTFSTNGVLASNRIARIIVRGPYVWIVYESYEDAGVSRYDRRTDDWITIKPMGGFRSGAEEIAVDEHYLWIGTMGEGVQRYHFASGSWTRFSSRDGLLSDHTLPHGLQVDERYVWIGTPEGLSRYDKQEDAWDNFTMLPALSGREVRTLAADEQYLWCGTGNGLARYDKQYGGWENYHEWERRPHWGSSATDERLADEDINAILLDDHYLWIGTRNGANRYDYIAGRWDRYRTYHGLPAEDVTGLSSDGNNIWMGTARGVGRHPLTSDDPAAWESFTSGTEIQASATSSEYATTLVADDVWCLSAGHNAIWVGTRLGVSRYDTRKGVWHTYTEADGLPTRKVNCITVAGDEVWFGSDVGAILHDSKTGQWKTYTEADGLPDKHITAIKVEGESVWFGTYGNGVALLNRQTGEWSYYTRQQGLAHDGVLDITIDGGDVWFGTQRGLSRLHLADETWTTFTQYHGPEDIAGD